MLMFDHICILGTDKRMDFAAQYFYDMGFDISREYHDLEENQVVLFAPNAGENEISETVRQMRKDSLLYIGKRTEDLKKLCEDRGIRLCSYADSPDFVQGNAVLTARGILKEAVQHNAVMEESHCLVCGYGFCGTEIAKELRDRKAYVDVLVRRKDVKSSVENAGCGCILMHDISHTSFEKYSYVFNTVPACILDEILLKRFSESVIVFDIASLPGGVDDSYCKNHNIDVYHSLGIPGRMFPRQAGELIAKEVYNNL